MPHTARSSARPGWAPVFIVLASFALRLFDLGGASLWIDEKLVEMWRHQSPADAFSSILSFGTEMPLYTLVMQLAPVEDELTLRLPSALLGMVGVALTMSVAFRISRNRSLALWSGALIATNPLHVWLSRTARAYALVFVLALLATFYFLQLLSEPRSRPARIAFVVSSAAAYLTHFFCLLLPLVQLITILRHRSRAITRRWLAAQSLAGLPVALWSAQIVILNVLSDGRFLGSHGEWLHAPSLLDLPLSLANLATGYDGRFAAWLWMPAFVAAGVGLWRGVSGAARKVLPPGVANHLILLAFLPVALAFAAAQFRPLYLDRYFVVGMPTLIILMAAGWQSLRSRLLRFTLPALVIATGVASIAADLQAGTHERIAWRQVGTYLAGAVQPGDGILLDRHVALDPFLHYFPRTTDDLTLWLSSASDDTSLQDVPAGVSVARLWVIYPNPHSDLHRQGAPPDFDPLEPGLTPIGDWLARQPGAIEAASFRGVKVLLVADDGESVRVE